MRADAAIPALAAVPLLVITDGPQTVNTKGTHAFTASGGVPPYTWSTPANPSGGGVVAGTGAYTAGDTGGGGNLAAVTDVVRVTDSAAQTANVNVTVNAAFPVELTPTVDLFFNTLGQGDNTDIASIVNAGSIGGTCFAFTTAPKYRTGVAGGKAVARFVKASTQALRFNTKQWGDAFSANTHTFFVVGINNSTTAYVAAAPFSNNDLQFGDTGGEVGVFGTNTVGSEEAAYNFPGAVKDIAVAAPVATLQCVMQRLDVLGTGLLGIKVGSVGVESTIASGATGAVGGLMTIGKGFGPQYADQDIAYILGYNTVFTASQIARVFNKMNALFGPGL